MRSEGPLLQDLTRRLAECPAEFLVPPSRVHVAAVVSDLLADLGGARLSSEDTEPFEAPAGTGKARVAAAANRLATQLVAAWLLRHPWFLAERRFASAARAFLASGLDDVTPLVPAARWVSEPDRREELARAALAALGLVPAGESTAQAEDRLATLDSVRRNRVLSETRKAQERIRAIREAMEKKAAAEAAAKYSRE